MKIKRKELLILTYWHLATNPTDECYEWQGAKNADGYGVLSSDGKLKLAHRLVLEWSLGSPIPEGIHAAHSCHNPSCINPRHLRAATPSENIRESVEAGRYNKPNLTGWERYQIIQSPMSIQAAAVKFKVSPRTIQEIRLNHKRENQENE